MATRDDMVSDSAKREIIAQARQHPPKTCEICGKRISLDEATCPIMCSLKNKICSAFFFCCKSHTCEEHVAFFKQRYGIAE